MCKPLVTNLKLLNSASSRTSSLEILPCFGRPFNALQRSRKQHQRTCRISGTFWHSVSLSGQGHVSSLLQDQETASKKPLKRLHLHLMWQRSSPYSSDWAKETSIALASRDTYAHCIPNSPTL